MEEVSDEGFTLVSAGWAYSCGLRVDRSAECWEWRADLFGHPDRPTWNNDPSDGTPPAGEFLTLDAGWGYACGIRPTGRVECWGWNPVADLEPPVGEFTMLSAGIEHACALRPSGEVECWGISTRREGVLVLSDGDGPFTAIAAEEDFLCGLRPGGEVECWGSDEFGKSTPPGGVFTQVTTSDDFACGLRPSGEVECWGGRDSSRLQSKVVTPRERLVSIDAGWGGWHNFDDPDSTLRYGEIRDWGYSCDLQENGTPLCWGDFTLRDSSSILPPVGEFLNVRMGQRQACGLRPEGSVECWGGIPVLNKDENLRSYEEGSVVYNDDPVAGEGYVDLVVGGWHACGLRPDGGVYCWNWWRGGIDTDYTLYTLEGPYESISAGYNHSCGLRREGGVDCWGLTGRIQRLPEAES